MQALTNRLFDEIDIGASTRVTRMLYKTEGELLALMAGDVDAFHLKAPEAAQGRAEDGVSARTVGTEALIPAGAVAGFNLNNS